MHQIVQTTYPFISGLFKQVGGKSLDSVAMGNKLRLHRDAWRTIGFSEVSHRGVTDFALHRFDVAHHRNSERQCARCRFPQFGPASVPSKSPSPEDQQRRLSLEVRPNIEGRLIHRSSGSAAAIRK